MDQKLRLEILKLQGMGFAVHMRESACGLAENRKTHGH